MNEELPANQSEVAVILQRLELVESMLQEQTQRLYKIEERLGLASRYEAPKPAQPPVSRTPSPTPNVPEKPIPKPEAKIVDSPSLTSPTIDSVPKAKPPITIGQTYTDRKLPAVNLEALIGGNWFNRIGILAIVIGMGFFLKLAFEREWIGPAGRVMIGVLVGVGLLLGCERMRTKGYKNYAHGLAGGGIAILYLTFFAAFARYELIDQKPAFALMAMVTTAAVLLAVRYDALAIAILGLIGGFITPILLSTGVDNQVGLFSYVVLLDLGVLAVAYFKRWRSLNYLAYGATVLMSLAWVLEWYRPEKLWTTMFFFTLLFVVFALLAVLYNIINRRTIEYPEISLIFANALIYFGASYNLLSSDYDSYLGLFAVFVAGFYLALGYLTYWRDRADKLLLLTFLGLASLFVTIAIPIQFDQHWVTMAWGIEGLILTWIGLRAANRTTYRAALMVFAIAIFHWWVIDVYAVELSSTFLPLLNRRAISVGVLIASLILAGRLHAKRQAVDEESSILAKIYLAAANLLALVLLTIDINHYFDQQMYALDSESYESASGVRENKYLSLALTWTVYGALAAGFGILKNWKWARLGGLALLGLAGFSLLLNNAPYFNEASQRLVMNKMFLAFVVFIATLFTMRWLYKRNAAGIDESETRIAYQVLTVTANVFALILLTLEAVGFFAPARNLSDEYREMNLAQRLSLSLVWVLYGGGMLVTGIVRSTKLLRLMGLILLAITTLKVFLFDLSGLDKAYRIISFIVLGGILLGVSFLYQMWQRKENREEGIVSNETAN